MDDWRKQIGVAYLVRQRVADLDDEELWPFHIPELAATEEELSDAENGLGQTLNAKYRDFLRFANGWQCFFHANDLFGTHDLVGGERRQRAEELLDTLEPLEEVCGVVRRECLPIAVSRDSIDVYVLTTSESNRPGMVHWLAGQLVDSFLDFDEFFLSMVDYNRDDAQALSEAS